MTERRLPPVTQLGMASLALIVAGGIYLSSHLPEHVPLTPAIILLVLYAIAVVTALVLERQAGEIVLMRSRGATRRQGARARRNRSLTHPEKA